jgi:hypothetical protein
LPLHYVGDGEFDCNLCEYIEGKEVSDETDGLMKSIKSLDGCLFYCNNKCVQFEQLNDRDKDCIATPELLNKHMIKLETSDTCYNKLSHRVWAPLCVYIKDISGSVMGCRDMSHLQNCTYFVCPEGYFKCSDTYCIPNHYVLDGIVDCPTGEEENSYNIDSCFGNFACWNSKICIHPDLVCDTKTRRLST